MGTSILTEIIEILTGGIVGIASSIGEGLSTLATSIFLTTTEGVTSLSTFGVLIAVFAGISLAVGLSRAVVGWVSSLGAKKV